MPRRTRGLGSASKVPLRGFTQLLQGLDPAVKNRLVDAFADAENLSDFHSRSVPDLQSRRNISGRIQKIQLFGESNLLGAFLSWDRVDDPRIPFYEVQTADTTSFSAPETTTTGETFVVFENIRTAKFARVRAVNSAGETGVWSNTVTLRPRTSAPETLSIEFYQGYSGVDPTLSNNLVYSGGVDTARTHPEFYSVLSKTFYADLTVGGLSVWGYVSSRLEEFADDGQTIWDRVRFRVNGLTRMEGYFPMWSIYPDATDFHANQRDATGAPMSFYARGGYTASFGPFAVTLPNSLDGEGPNDPFSVVPIEFAGASFYWSDPNNALRASRFDEAQMTGPTQPGPIHEASSLQIDEGASTEWLVFRDFRFDIRPEAPILGIEAKIKRRQISVDQNPFRKDNGFSNPLIPIDNPDPALQPIGEGSILNDVDFGRFVDFPVFETVGSFPNNSRARLEGQSTTSVDGIGNFLGFTGNDFSICGWFNNTFEDANLSGSFRGYGIAYFDLVNNPIAGAPDTQFRLDRQNYVTNPRLTIQGVIDGRFISLSSNNFFSTSNEWIHIGVTYRSSTRTFIIYKNGVPVRTIVIPAPNVTAGLNKVQDYTFQLGDHDAVSVGDAGGHSQWALFDSVLSGDEMMEITEARGTADLRRNFGDYESSSKLLHYWLYIPDQADIRDAAVHIVDKFGNIRTDLTNQAAIDETWPRLSTYFYTNERQFGFLPLALSDGVPHDNHTAIGYQKYGGEFDTWGLEGLTGADVNEFYFGFAIRATNEPLNGFPGDAFIDHGKLTVYTTPFIDRNIEVDVDVAAASHFYLRREVFGACLNVISLGERLVSVPKTGCCDDC